MILGKKTKVFRITTNTINISSDEARALGMELIRQAEETEDHKWEHIVNVLDEDNIKKSLVIFSIHLSLNYWELLYVKYLNDHNIIWKRNLIKFPYEWENKTRYYIPDFYLIEENKYIKIKEYKTEKDKAECVDFPYQLDVLYKQDIIDLIGSGIQI